MDLQNGTSKRITDMKSENVMSVQWLKDERLMFSMQTNGQESFGWYAVNADGSNLTIIRQATTVNANEEVQVAGGREQILNTLPLDPNEIVVGLVRGSSGLMDIYRMNVHKENAKRLICTNPGKVREWITDSKGVPRIGTAQDERGLDQIIYYRANDKSEWVELDHFKQDAPRWEPLGFDADDQTLYVASNIGRKTFAVYTYDLQAHKLGPVVVEDPVYDVGNDAYGYEGGLVVRGRDHKVLGVNYLADRPKTVWLDAEMIKLQSDIDRALPHTLNRIGSATRDGSKCILNASSDRDPGTYYLLDIKNLQLLELLRINSKVDPAQMSTMQSVSYTARDGMQLHAFLTLPEGRLPKNLPLIVHPHGGPYGPRDAWGFNANVQFLANRGYAVLQPNFRGSGGYGPDYEAAGYRQWGLQMQDDLTDGAQWLIKEGIVDPARVGIYGASYGGYAAMMGPIKEPQLFSCAINYVGVTDIRDLFPGFEDFPKFAQESVSRRFGHPVKDKAYMDANSPAYQADRIQCPVLMAYGFFDPRVKLEQGEKMYKAMKAKGRDVEYIVSGNEGHGFRKEENAIAFMDRIDAFLKKNLYDRKSAQVIVGKPEGIQMPAK